MTFKEQYQNKEFRERHKKYILEKVQCSCGTITARCNMSHHRLTKHHKLWHEKWSKDDIKEKIKEIEELKKKIQAKYNDKIRKIQEKIENLQKIK